MFPTHPHQNMASDHAELTEPKKAPSSRRFLSSSACDTPCRRKSSHCAISMIAYRGQWYARCDVEGKFLPQQCDNTRHCFCVDTDGKVMEGTKVLGDAQCE